MSSLLYILLYLKVKYRKAIPLVFVLVLLFVDANSCGCPPPFPNQKNRDLGYSTFMINEHLYASDSDVGADVRVFKVEYVNILFDTATENYNYYRKVLAGKIDPDIISLEQHYSDLENSNRAIIFSTVVLKNLKYCSKGDTLSIFSDYSSCGVYLDSTYNYRIYGFKVHPGYYCLEKDSAQSKIPIKRQSYDVSYCTIAKIQDDRIEE